LYPRSGSAISFFANFLASGRRYPTLFLPVYEIPSCHCHFSPRLSPVPWAWISHHSTTKGTPTGKPTRRAQAWRVLVESRTFHSLTARDRSYVLVSLPQQTMHVYRNGILIGRSSNSAAALRATPRRREYLAFSIRRKRINSKTYNNAPMPNMQRLTWTGYRHALWPVAWLSGQPRLHPIAI